MTADAAIVAVRQVRPGAIETPSQEAYVRRMPPVAAKPHERSGHSIAGAVHDRARGALVGLAIGGALGTTIEFTRRDAKPKQTDLTRGGPFHLIPG